MSKKEKEKEKILIKTKSKYIFYKSKKKYIAIFLVKEQKSYSILGYKKVNPLKLTVKFKGIPKVIDISNYTYSKGYKQYYLIDMKEGQLFLNEGVKSNLNADILDMIEVKHIITQLTTNLNNSALKISIMTLVFGAILGGLVGYIIAGAG